MNKKLPLILAIASSGCASFSEQCAEDGYAQGTPAFEYCIARRQQAAQAAAMIFAAGMQNAGQSFQQSAAAQQYYQPRRTINCYQIGQQTQCTSY